MDLTPYKNCRAFKQWLFVSNKKNPYRPCCWATNEIAADSYEDYTNQLKQVDIAKNCDYCIKMEANGGDWSPRIEFESQTKSDDVLVITASFDNFCNLKCVTCAPENSSGIATELGDDAIYDGRTKKQLIHLMKETPKKVEFLKQTIQNTNFKSIRLELLGGEPLINPTVFGFLDWLAEQPIAKNSTLGITTNGTTYSEKIRYYATKFIHVTLQFSIDGTDGVFEYLRTNSENEVMNANVDKFYELSKELDNLHITFNFTLSWMNCLNFPDFLNWMVRKYPRTAHVLVTKLISPPQFAVDILSTELKKKIVSIANSKLPTLENPAFIKALSLYTQHMTLADTTYDSKLFLEGLDILRFKDNKRKTNYITSLSSILQFLYDNLNPEEKSAIQKKIIGAQLQDSKTFCILPWVHQYVDPDSGVRPCCAYEPNTNLGSLKTNTLEEIWNNEETKKVRRQMLNGEKVAGCIKCDSRQELNMYTFRDESDVRFGHKNKDFVYLTELDGSLPVHNLKYIDARFNNLCNFRCRTCGPRLSTSWYEESLLTEPHDENRKSGLNFPGKTEDQLLEEIWPHIPNLEEIYFAGGEPLMQIQHYKILEELVRIGHTGSTEKPLHIYYNTNFSTLKLGKYSALELWKNFNNLSINASIDGSYKKAEYWRKGTKWDVIVDNLQKLKTECPNVNFVITYTLSWVNAYNLIDLHREWVMKNYIGYDSIMLNILDMPAQYSLKNIPQFKKDKIKELFLKQIEWLKKNNAGTTVIRSYEDAIKFMESVQTNDDFLYKTEFKHVTGFYDDLRKEDFFETYSEHQDIKDWLNRI